MIQGHNSASLIPFLKDLIERDRLIFEEYDTGKKIKASVAYSNHLIIFVDTGAKPPILIIARSYNFWAELLSPDYPVGNLSFTIAKQDERLRNSPDGREKIAKDKLKKFRRDMVLRAERELLQREKILEESREILSYLLNSSPVEGT